MTMKMSKRFQGSMKYARRNARIYHIISYHIESRRVTWTGRGQRRWHQRGTVSLVRTVQYSRGENVRGDFSCTQPNLASTTYHGESNFSSREIEIGGTVNLLNKLAVLPTRSVVRQRPVLLIPLVHRLQNPRSVSLPRVRTLMNASIVKMKENV